MFFFTCKLKNVLLFRDIKNHASFSSKSFTFLTLMQRFICFNGAIIHYEGAVQRLEYLLRLAFQVGLET